MICCSLSRRELARLRNVEPDNEGALLEWSRQQRWFTSLHLTTMATPPLLQQRCSPHDKDGLSPPWLSGLLPYVALVSTVCFPTAGQTLGFNALSAKGECRRYRVMWVLAFWLSAWMGSTTFLGPSQTPKRIWWCFLLVLSVFCLVFFFSQIPS